MCLRLRCTVQYVQYAGCQLGKFEKQSLGHIELRNEKQTRGTIESLTRQVKTEVNWRPKELELEASMDSGDIEVKWFLLFQSDSYFSKAILNRDYLSCWYYAKYWLIIVSTEYGTLHDPN